MKQKVDENNEKAVINQDEKEQARILKFLCTEFQVSVILLVSIMASQTGFKNSNDEPFAYWDYVLSDSFAETVENMFYFSFLFKLQVIEMWFSDEYRNLLFVPNFDMIDESKFGRRTATKNKKRNLSAQ